MEFMEKIMLFERQNFGLIDAFKTFDNINEEFGLSFAVIGSTQPTEHLFAQTLSSIFWFFGLRPILTINRLIALKIDSMFTFVAFIRN